MSARRGRHTKQDLLLLLLMLVVVVVVMVMVVEIEMVTFRRKPHTNT